MKIESLENNERYTFQVDKIGKLKDKLSSKAMIMMQYIYHVRVIKVVTQGGHLVTYLNQIYSHFSQTKDVP